LAASAAVSRSFDAAKRFRHAAGAARALGLLWLIG
jgi:hypothetical protein